MAADSGSYTPETVARRYKMAEELLKPKKITHWAEGLNALAEGAVGGMMEKRARDEEREGGLAASALIAKVLGGEGGNPAAAPGMNIPSARPMSAAPPVNPAWPGETASPATPGGASQDMAWALPQSGPIDRSAFRAELEANPELRRKILAISLGENRNPDANVATIESMMNRAAARGTTLAEAAKLHPSSGVNEGRGGYYAGYAPQALNDPRLLALASGSLDKALGGSNVSNYATDNASQGLAARNEATGRFNPTFKAGGETFFSPGTAGGRSGPASVQAYDRWRGGLKGPEMEPVQVASLDPSIGLPGAQEVRAPSTAGAVQQAQMSQAQPSMMDTASLPNFAPPRSQMAQTLNAPVPPAQSGNTARDAIIQGLNSPNPFVRNQAMKMAPSLMQQDKPTDEQREFAQAKREGFQGTFMDYKTQLKKAGATNVNTSIDNSQKAEGEFEKEGAKLQAKRFNDLVDEAPKAQQMQADLQVLTDLGKNIGTGKAAEIKAALGPFAEALGIPIDKLSDIQAFEAVVNRMAPNLRVPGSGAQSDYELRNFVKSLPTLGNTPEGNEIASSVMQGLIQNKLLAAEIGSKALNKEITRSEAEKQLRALPDPLGPYREYMKKNRGAPTAAGAPDEGWKDMGNGVRIREKR